MKSNILLISDTHIMSNWGLVDPDFICHDKRGAVRFDLNEMLEWNWNYWCDTAYKNRNVDAIIFNGDLVDGLNTFNYGAVATDDIYQQIKMAVGILGMLPEDIPRFFTRGTKFHSGNDIVSEHIIADMMGGLYSDEAIIETCGIRIYTNHFAPHAQNKAGGLENRLKMLAAAEDTYGKVHGLYNAHNHKFSCVMTKSHFGVLTPGWQHKTPYAIQKNLITPSDIGYVNLIVEDEELITIDKRGVKTSPFGCEVLKW